MIPGVKYAKKITIFYGWNVNGGVTIESFSLFWDPISYHEKVLISFIKEHRGPTFRPHCYVIDDVTSMKNTFSDIIWYNLGPYFHAWGKLEDVFNIPVFSACPHWSHRTCVVAFWQRFFHHHPHPQLPPPAMSRLPGVMICYKFM